MFLTAKMNAKHQNKNPIIPKGEEIENAVYALTSKKPVSIPTIRYIPGKRIHPKIPNIIGCSFINFTNFFILIFLSHKVYNQILHITLATLVVKRLPVVQCHTTVVL
ncbi:MAG: hypothetical protein A2233_02005 [Candidatus Kerfeldbacteria bacterium RIFOXYA2_FULL_38_24]|uniref:Uncharacterized protein n=1 Tax=Candidatus Kerfeldbacteria bacterium RIFOXYB2_FULL_38_14 TaxID=1798547 RepID=A0A1G2BGN5_9BACT|nr:MAG: hypothetical protein A2319_04605 [Candidatus Kerfeldbacteria bacterium RIFOXYB2_FULL_38_14]OGY87889.1 MAG: hypothetical protein A2233_02005 [Candidatus Kerfeldbacteria bacterium RIFOXYA2_FULL_38_24]OGY88696.1 MAG: hypothetical protein A2458_03600 [Candidatus Kerfeldbacteria bacterium RIFOXYC2_FULL_38_9]